MLFIITTLLKNVSCLTGKYSGVVMCCPLNELEKNGKKKRVMALVINSIKRKMAAVIKTADAVMRSRAVETVEYEIDELDNIFGILVLGAFIGIPAPPIHITMELLPLMDRELNIMLEKVSTAHDPLGDLFSVLEID